MPSCVLSAHVSIPSSRVGTKPPAKPQKHFVAFPSPQVGSEQHYGGEFPQLCDGFHPLKSGRNHPERDLVWYAQKKCFHPLKSGRNSWETQSLRRTEASFHPLKSGRNRSCCTAVAWGVACFHPLKSGRNSPPKLPHPCPLCVSIPSSRVGTGATKINLAR